MGRPERPIDSNSALSSFATQLRKLRDSVGRPTYRQLAQRSNYSSSTLAEAARGHRLPTLPVVLAYVAACGGDARAWEQKWNIAANQASHITVPPDSQDLLDQRQISGERLSQEISPTASPQKALTTDVSSLTRRKRWTAVTAATGLTIYAALLIASRPRPFYNSFRILRPGCPVNEAAQNG